MKFDLYDKEIEDDKHALQMIQLQQQIINRVPGQECCETSHQTFPPVFGGL